MSSNLLQRSSFIPPIKEFFIARQPILDRNERLAGYELLFHGADSDRASPGGAQRSLSVIAHMSELGIENVVGASRGFLNVDFAVLMNDLVKFIPHEKVVFEIPQTIKITPELIRCISQMVASGYTFALDDVITFSQYIKPLLPLIKIVKINTSVMTRTDLVLLVEKFKETEKLLLAERVETVEQFRNCTELGFDYYQGYYFARPLVLSGKRLTSSQLGVMQLITLLGKNADNAEIEHNLKKDVALCLSLLRLVNTAERGISKNISSVSEALVMLGHQQLQRWLQIQLYVVADSDNHCSSPLLSLATTRGKLLELIAGQLQPADKAASDTAFTVGILSLLDALFGQPMKNILQELALGDEIRAALLYRSGFYGDLLKLAEYIEKPDETRELLSPLLLKVELSIDELFSMQLRAFEWSNQGQLHLWR